ncbi:MAG: hypothetical protein H6Q17_1172 [Bacteroidetes bacterium]|nr:hypothetical protein [Bacteroidota bacterium]
MRFINNRFFLFTLVSTVLLWCNICFLQAQTLSATLSGSTKVCQNATSPNIIFKAFNGTAPYSFTYTFNGSSDQTIITSSSSDSAYISIPTGFITSFNYKLKSVTDATGSTQDISGQAVTVVINDPPSITGSTGICVGGNTIQLSVGTSVAASISPWISSNSDIATVDNSGTVKSVSIGSTTITYTDENGCSASQNITVNPIPNVDFSYPVSSCAGNEIAFLSSISGDSGSSYSYTWNFGDESTSTEANPSHRYYAPGESSASKDYIVSLTATNTTTSCYSSQAHTITVKCSLDPNLTSNIATLKTYNGVPTFIVCESSSTEIDFINSSTTTAHNQNYTIDWGDGTSSFSTNTAWTSTTHTYSVGLYTLKFSITGDTGCDATREYKVFVGSNPSISLGNPGNTQRCIDETLEFPISSISNNPPGTTYVVSYNDGSSDEYYDTSTLPSSISHKFLKTSCGTYSSVGSSIYENAFYVKVLAQNPCGPSESIVIPIYISTPAVAQYSLPSEQFCTNSSITLNNTSVDGTQASPVGCATSKVLWKITPSTGVTVVGTLGSDNGYPDNTTKWTKGSNDISLTFTQPGTYTITMTNAGTCNTSVYTKSICVTQPLDPEFTLNNNSVCINETVTTTNTTDISNSCSDPTYFWSVAYAADNCGTTPSYSFTNGTNATSQSPSFVFNTAGSYTLTLMTQNECGTQTLSKTVTVKQAPTATINSISNYCGTATISPSATINLCAPSSASIIYDWNLTGGNPASASTATPGTVSYNIPGNYAIALKVSNECGSTTDTTKFIVKPLPKVTNATETMQQITCSGIATTAVDLTSDLSGTTFTWIATAESGLSGYQSSGTGNSLPSQNIINSTNSQKKIVYSITPYLDGCSGNSVSYTFFIDPAPSITAHPISTALCKNGSTSPLTVAYTNGTGTPSYQWYKNNNYSTIGATSIDGETTSSYAPPTNTVGTTYYFCTITFSSTNCSLLTSNIAAVTIAEQPSIATHPTAEQALCVGGSIQAPLSITYLNGAGTPHYQWYSNDTNSNSGGTVIDGATNASYSPSAYTNASDYYYYATLSLDGNGCNSTNSNTAKVTVVEDPIIDSQPITTQTVCQNVTPTSLTVTASGGVPSAAFAYQWYQNSINSNISGTKIIGAQSASYEPPTSTAGTLYYYCIVTQPSGPGCSATSATSEVIVKLAPTFTTQPTSSDVCSNGSPYTLTVAYQDGVGEPTYQWYSNASNSNSGGTAITGAESASYTPSTAVTGTTYYYCTINLPSGGCSSITSATATVKVNNPPSISTQPVSDQSLCTGGSLPVSLSVDYTGGTGSPSYQWYSNTSNSNAGGNSITGATSSTYMPPAYTSVNDYYYYAVVTLSGNNCGNATSNPASVHVIADPQITSQSSASQSICQNSVPSDLFVNVSGGLGDFSYRWYRNTTNSNSGGTSIAAATQATYTPSTSTVGTMYYYCEITQTGVGCGVTSTPSAVVVTPAPSIDTQPASSTVCLGETPTLLHVTYQNGVGVPSYQWFSNSSNTVTGGTAITGASSDSYLPPHTAIGTTYYYCVLTFSSGGCSNSVSDIATVTINPVPFISDKTALIVSDDTFSVTPVNGGSEVVPTSTTYTWSTPVVTPAGAITGASAQTTGQTSISQTLTNTTTLPATVTYTVTPLAGSCTGNPFAVVVSINPSIKVTTTVTNCSCFGVTNGSIQALISGGVPFTTGEPQNIQWSGPNGFTATTATISDLAPGDYSLTVTDAGGFPFYHTYTITEPDDIVLSTSDTQNVTCNGIGNGTIDISVTGGTPDYSYTWTKDGAAFSTTQNIDHLTPGIYEVAVTDSHNCAFKRNSYTITEPAILTSSITGQTNVLCYGDATGALIVTATGGTPSEMATGVYDYQYAWTGPDGFVSSLQNIAGLKAGNYSLTVTDKNGCISTLPATITQNDDITVGVATTPITCYGLDNASITLTINGGTAPYQVNWSNLASGSALTNLSAGDYVYTITDANNCQKTNTVHIAEAPIFTIVPVVKNVSCYGAHDGSIKLNILGNPISVIWSDGSTSGNERNNIGPGSYTVTISDGTPCTIVRTFVITEPELLSVSGIVTNAIDCSNVNSGAITQTVTGGTEPYSYVWSNGATSKDLTDIQAGTYSVTTTDKNGCIQTTTYTVFRPQPISVEVTTSYDYTCSTQYLQQIVNAKVSGGIPPYQYTWSNGKSNSSVMQTDQSGLVILTVTDSRGCSANYTLNSDVPTLGIRYQLLNCNDRLYQFSTVVVDEATENYTYRWDFGDGYLSSDKNVQHKYTKAGTYKINLTITGKSCTTAYSKAITVEALPTLSISPTEAIFCEGDSLTVIASGANTYKWNNGSTADYLLLKQDGNYSVIGTTTAGCYDTLTFTASYYPMYSYPILSDKNEVSLKYPTVSLWSDDHPALYYLWNFGDNTTAENINQTHTYNIKKGGYYDVVLTTTDLNGCKSSSQKRIWITNDTELNTFTPNGDGLNDVFLKGWHVKIYNRNGVLITDSTDGWDGTYHGKLVSPDTYFYVVYYMSESGTKTKEGYVTLVR